MWCMHIEEGSVCAGVGVHAHDSGGNLRSNAFFFLISLNGYPRSAACREGLTKVCLSCNFNAFFLLRVRLGLQC